MKRFSFFLAACACMLLISQRAQAQDFFKTDAGMFKLLADTTFASIAEVTFEPGAKTNTHTHSAAFIYALSDGTLTVHYADGKTMEIALKAGDSMLGPADGPHWTENKGKKAIKFLLVEFDEHPYMAMKDMKMKK